MVDKDGSDLMLASGSKPMIRIHGDLMALDFGDGDTVLSTELTQKLIYEI